MNTYSIVLEVYGVAAVTCFGETPSKAKYNIYLERGDAYETFQDFLQAVLSIRLIHKFKPSDLFGDIERFERMKNYRNIPFAFMGMKVNFKSHRGLMKGIIVGANDSLNLDICFEGTSHKENCHPHYNLIYLDNLGKIIKEYNE